MGLVLSHGELLEGRVQLPRRVRQDGVGEGDPWAARLGPVGHDVPRHLVGERVQAICCVRPMGSGGECGEQLVARGAARAGGEEAERDVERERGEDGVGVVADRESGRGEGSGEAEREAGLLRDGQERAGHGRCR